MSLVGEHLEKRSVPFEAITHTRTYTTLDEARTLGIAAEGALKTVVLKTGSGHALAVVPGTRRLSMRLTRQATGDSHVRLATEDELHRHFPDFELGAFPPLGSLLGVPLFVDPEVMEHDRVVFAAGSQTESVLMRTEDLFATEDPTVVPLSRRKQAVPDDPEPAPPAVKPAAWGPTARKRTTATKAPERGGAKRKPTSVTQKKGAKQTAKKPTGKRPTTKRAVKRSATKRAGEPARERSATQKKPTAKKAAKPTLRAGSRLPRSSRPRRSQLSEGVPLGEAAPDGRRPSRA